MIIFCEISQRIREFFDLIITLLGLLLIYKMLRAITDCVRGPHIVLV